MIMLDSDMMSQAYVSLLREFEKRNFKIHIIAGDGVGLAISSLYAIGKNSNEIDWFFHKLTHKINKKNYSKFKKKEIFRTALAEQLGHKLIQETPTTLLVPRSSDQRVSFVRNGKLIDVFKKSENSRNIEKNLSSEFLNYIYSKYGIDLLVIAFSGRRFAKFSNTANLNEHLISLDKKYEDKLIYVDLGDGKTNRNTPERLPLLLKESITKSRKSIRIIEQILLKK